MKHEVDLHCYEDMKQVMTEDYVDMEEVMPDVNMEEVMPDVDMEVLTEAFSTNQENVSPNHVSFHVHPPATMTDEYQNYLIFEIFDSEGFIPLSP